MLILFVRLGVEVFRQLVKWEYLYYVAIVVGIIFLISLCDELNDRFKRLPFGPMRLPLYGNRLQLFLYGGNRPYVAITRLARGYKDGFMKIFFGLTGYVSVNGTAAISEILGNEEEWAGERDEVWRLDRTETEKRSTAGLAVWISRRNIAIRCLKEHTSRVNINTLIAKQVADLLVGIENQERVDKLAMREITSETFLPYTVSTVWSVLTGNTDLEVTNRRVHAVHRCLKDWEENSEKLAAWADHYPFLVRWFPGWAGFNKLQEVNHDFRKVLKALIKEQYKKAVTNRVNPESYVQACIREFKELRKNSFGSQQMNDSSSIALLFEFLCPGPLMAASHASFCLFFAARDPTAQERIVKEIYSVFGESEVPTWDKHERMPYTHAFILETYRLASIVPLERRQLLKLVRRGDTRFPKEMPLMFNYHSANMDPKVWDDPQLFLPQRFLSANGKQVVNQEKLVSLAAEKQLCAGQALLQMTLFSFFTGTLQKWRVELNPNFVDKGPIYGIINKPQPFRVVLKPRVK